MDNKWQIYDDMNLYIRPNVFIIEPNGKDEILIINRGSDEMTVHPNNNEIKHETPSQRVCGILGTINLIAGRYLIVAVHRLFVGILNGANIWRLAGYGLIPYISSKNHLTPKQREHNKTYLRMLRQTLNTHHFYFSYCYDLTRSSQSQHSLVQTELRPSLRGSFLPDSRFVWNATLLRNFNNNGTRQYQLPIILGFVSINQVQVNGQTFFWSIISRRSVRRAGTRLFCRGINDNGNVANYVETEQIVEFNGERISFVQTRGSMPFYWRQLPNLRYKPTPQLISGKDHLAACAEHFNSEFNNYGRQVLVNLVDQKGAEGVLEKAYRTFVQQINNPHIRYEAFDFHSECKKMRWDRLNILIDRLAHEQEEFSVFHLRDEKNVVSMQKGVFRTNCIDCLDRTNVVQSMLAKRSLNNVLQKLGILHIGQHVETASPQFEMIFKAVWADNADMISLQYSGTGALKTDFTRTGKRTLAGMLNDGINSCTRYYLNNFKDGSRQDGIDLFLGKHVVFSGESNSFPSPLVNDKGWRYNTFPAVLCFAIGMFFISALFPSELDTASLLFLLFWGAMIGVSISGILHYGDEFVDWPRLAPPYQYDA